MDFDALVTGAGGFSGRAIVRRLAASGPGYSVLAVTRKTDKVITGAAAVVGLDLYDGLDLLPPVKVVIHCAATSVGRPQDMARDNVEATRNVVRYAARHRAQLIFLSTMSVFGESPVEVVDPNTPVVNPKPYGASKLLCEQMVMQTWEGAGAISLRLPAVVGRGAHRHWLSKCVALAKAGDPISYYGASGLFNNAIHIDDLCDFIETLIQKGLHGYDMVTLGAAGSMTVRELVDTICSAFGGRSPVEQAMGGSLPFLISNEKAIEQYGYRPRSIRGTIRQYLEESL